MGLPPGLKAYALRLGGPESGYAFSVDPDRQLLLHLLIDLLHFLLGLFDLLGISSLFATAETTRGNSQTSEPDNDSLHGFVLV